MTSPVDRVTYEVVGRDSNATGLFRGIANEADRAGDSLTNLGQDFNGLDAEIDDTSNRLRNLLTQIADMGDLTLFEDLRVGDIDTAALQEIENVMREVADQVDRTDQQFRELTTGIDGSSAAAAGLNQQFDGLGDETGRVNTLAGAFRALAGDIATTRERIDTLAEGGAVDVTLGSLDRELAEVARRVRELNNAINDTDNERLLEGTEIDQTFLQQLGDLRSRLRRSGSDAGSALATGVVVGFAVHFASIGARAIAAAVRSMAAGSSAGLGTAGLAVGAALAVAAAAVITTTLGAAISAAIIGGVGIGGVVGGLALAAQDARVKNHLDATGSLISHVMRASAHSFVPALIQALSTVRVEFGKLRPQLDDLFTGASSFVQPLTSSLMQMVRNALPGLVTAVRNAKPIIDVLVAQLPKLGTSVGRFFSELSEHAPAAARALNVMFFALRVGIRVIEDILSLLTEAFEKIDVIVTFTLDGPAAAASVLAKYRAEEEKIKNGSPDVQGALGGVSEAFLNLGNQAGTTASQIDQVRQAFTFAMNAANAHISAGHAEIAMYDAMEAAVSRANEAQAAGVKGIDVAVPAQRRNFEALLGIASAANAATQAIIDENGSMAEAARKSGVAEQEFIKVAESMGLSRTEAILLANKLFAIPRSVPVDVNMPNAEKTIAQAKAIRDVVQGIRSKNIHIGVFFTTSGDLKLPGGTQIKGASEGGPVLGPGQKGRDSVPLLLAPGEHVLTAREVDAAGGHEAIEAWRRSLLGGSGTPAPTSRAGGGGSVMDIDRIAVALRRAFSGMTLLIDDRSGRTAQLLARGG